MSRDYVMGTPLTEAELVEGRYLCDEVKRLNVDDGRPWSQRTQVWWDWVRWRSAFAPQLLDAAEELHALKATRDP